MTDRLLRYCAGGVFGATVCLGLGGFLLKATVTSDDIYAIPFFAFALLGLVVVFRQPRNAAGWLFLLAGSAPTLGSFFPASYAIRALDEGLPGATVAEWVSTWAWFPGIGAFLTFGLLLFPDGRLPSRRWRGVAYLSVLLIIAVPLSLAIQPGPMESFDPSLPPHDNPFGWEGGRAFVEVGRAVAFSLLPLLGSLAATSLIFRYKNSSVEQRQQIKWFAYSAFLVVVAVAAKGSVERSMGSTAASWMLVLGMLFPSGGAAIGMLKYRLYDIDVVINRTLVYLILTGSLAFTYLSVVVVLQSLLAPVTSDSDVAVAGSTLAVAAMFRPFRAWIQDFIDRRFYRRKYDAQRTLEGFSSRLRDEVDLDHLAKDLTIVVSDTMQPAHVSVWLREARL